ncbi:hypothetical protein B0H17DRAFT_1157952 [Mycena rosella]|uniref:Glutamate--tRNA ligase n=1 Tax=Mycena rosella TaxID=1033263 RepID=A0AAD7DVC2_MYCRO|nr:hypothetical protein B0H17DRAFT_1157952 [Mycena rosella]
MGLNVSAPALFPFACDISVHLSDTSSGPVLELIGGRIESQSEIIHALAMKDGRSCDGSLPRIGTSNMQEIIQILDKLNAHLALRTFLVGHAASEADYTLWGCLKGDSKAIGLLRTTGFRTMAMLAAAKATTLKTQKTAARFALGLPNAIHGHVVTRFPPEPSGYLHIGHAKAVMLNHYFAKMYDGKLLIRFDDTNPSREKSAVGDSVTHTSDYFDQLHEYAVQLINSGKAYADDTDATMPLDHVCSCPAKSHAKLTKMGYERFHGIPSSRCDASIGDNQVRFSQMTLGTVDPDGAKWCLRAKINPNKALRDPVIYRSNPVTHHRTGDKCKVYPTYDFACPVVDSIEGVTHALRTNEYRDRNPQYHWMIEALGLRPVNIWDCSRLNFVYTVLSKRKLQQFVDRGHVRGWDDPRRGLNVEALQQFMLQQGPSEAVLSLEWDSIWALNRKMIGPQAPRFCAVLKDKRVSLTVFGGPTEPYFKLLPKHKKNPVVGEKTTVYSSSIIMEQMDAASFEDGEENAIVRGKTVAEDGSVLTVTVDLHLVGDVKATQKKVTWLAQIDSQPLVEVALLDYDYIITKKRLEGGDKFCEEALADRNVLGIASTADNNERIIQFERKGYYILDGRSSDGRLDFIKIPDARAASLAKKA